MKKVLVDYLIKIRGDAADAKEAMKDTAEASERVRDNSEKVERTTERSSANIANLQSGVAAAAAAFAAASAAAVVLANDITDAVDRIGTLASNSGLAADTIKGLDAVAKSSGKELKALVPDDFAKRVFDVSRGAGEAKAGFEALGISVATASGEMRSADEVLLETTAALKAIEDPTKRAALAQTIFGSASQELVSALSDTADLQAWIEYTRIIGTDVGPEAVAVTSEWQQTMTLASLATDSMKSALMPLVSWMSKTVLGLTAMGVAASGFVGAMAEFRNPIDGAADAFREWRDATEELHVALAGVTDESRRASRGYEDFRAKLGFDPGTSELSFLVSNVTAGRGLDGSAPHSSPGVGGVGKGVRKRSRGGPSKIDNAALLRQSNQSDIGYLPEVFDSIVDTLSDQVEDLEDAFEPILAAFDAVAAEQAAAMEAAAEAERAALDRIEAEAERHRQLQDHAAQDPIGLASGAAYGALMALAGPLAGLATMPSQIDNLTATVRALPDQLMDLPELVTGLTDAIADLPQALIAAIPEIARALANLTVGAFLVGTELIVQALAALFDAIPGRIAEAIADVFRDFTSQLNPFDGDGQFAFGLAGKALDAVPFFDTGGDVTSTGLAVVHEGERVMTREERRAMFGGLRSGPVSIQVVNPDPVAAARAVRDAVTSGYRFVGA